MKIGDIIDNRFQIERLAGSGGMGVVYQASDRQAGGDVALKVLGPRGTDMEARFAREARLLSTLEHKGIVRYVAHGRTQGGEAYLAMEWLDGEDLAARLSRDRLTVDEVLALGRCVAEALGAAHARGIVHRDIKPGNIFLVDGDIHRAKLLDFGVARGQSATLALTETGAMLGTIAYMSPEQARGDRDVDARADVFALGCVLFECVTGQPPFNGAHALAVLAKILMEEAPSMCDLRPEVPSLFAGLVARMLSKRAVDRPSDASVVLAELGAGRPTPPAELRQALTSGEQRIVSVILVGPEPELEDADDALRATMMPDGSSGTLSRLRAAATPFTTRVEALIDGSMVAIIAPQGAATDQVTMAARSALAMRAAAPRAPIVIATGRGMVDGRLPIGEVIDRAVAALRADIRPIAPRYPRIWIDDVTAGLLNERFEIAVVGGHHELRGLRGSSAEVVRTLLGVPTPCVGRDRELATLGGILDECVTERVARVVLVTGPPGIGKSRLRYEFLRNVRSRAAHVEAWLACCDPITGTAPHALLAEVLRTALGLSDGVSLEARREKLRARVAERHGPERAQHITLFLGELMGTPFPDESNAVLRAARGDPALLYDEMMSAFRDFLAEECATHPTLVILEDLHWADAASVAAINGALRELTDSPLMLVALARQEVHDTFPKLWTERRVQEIGLGELPRRAAESLVRELLGDAATPAILDRVTSLAGGNAFYLEELIRAVAGGQQTELPETVLAMVEARVAELTADARRVLRAASVLGEVFWAGAVQSLLGAELSAGVLPALHTLAARELVSRRPRSKFANDLEYRFRHATVHDAAYAMLVDEDRALGHRLAAEWLELVGGGDLVVLAQSAQHGVLAGGELGRLGRRDEAAAMFAKAASQRASTGHFEGAVVAQVQAVENAILGSCAADEILVWLAALSDLVNTSRSAPGLLPILDRIVTRVDRDGTLDQRAHARIFLAQALGAADLFAQGCSLLDEAATLDAARVDVRRKALVTAVEIFGRKGDIEPALRAARALDELGPPDDPRGLLALAYALASGGDFARAYAAVSKAEALSDPQDERAVHGRMKILGTIHLEAGNYKAAVEVVTGAVDLARRLGLRYDVAANLHNLGDTQIQLGDYSAARAALAESLLLAEADGQRRLILLNRTFLAYLDGLDGAPDAIVRLRRFVDDVVAAGNVVVVAQNHRAQMSINT